MSYIHAITCSILFCYAYLLNVLKAYFKACYEDSIKVLYMLSVAILNTQRTGYSIKGRLANVPFGTALHGSRG